MTASQVKRERARMGKVLSILKAAYPDAKCALEYRTPYQLLAATILSAQCTDAMVNRVSPVLFARYPDARAMADGKMEEIERIIRSTGFYKNKAQSLKEMSQALLREYGGQVPASMEKLTRLRGVGRKTANVVLGNAFGIPGLVVDTHVGRLCHRMGFTEEQAPERVEAEMMELVPKSDWTIFSHLLISHGRAVCIARKAACERCPVAELCPKVDVPQFETRPPKSTGLTRRSSPARSRAPSK
ncbi:MAG: endonuclease III [Bdellovibrionales bacterium]|nr:endonuclease III [Bdellovibrionales bacterium]